MKRFNRIICIILALVCMLVGVVGCNGNGGKTLEVKGVAKNKQSTHIYTVSESSDYLVKNGKSDYVIVYPDGATAEYLHHAITELQGFFKEATGITLPIVTDGEVTEGGKYLHIGYTASATAEGFSATAKNLNNTSAYIIRNKNGSVYMVGGGNFGHLYAVYKFLELQFGYKCYASDEIVIDKDVMEEKLLNFEVTDVPDFEFRNTSHGEENYDRAFARRLRVQQEDEFLIPIAGETVHNWINIIPPSVYGVSHPEWFNSEQTQLCLTQDPEGLANEVLKNIKPYLLAYPDYTMFTYTQEDGTSWGDDAISKENYEKYGTQAVEALRFQKLLAGKIEAWLNAEYPERKLTYMDFAYSHTIKPPVVKNDDGTYTPMENDLKLPSNASIWFTTQYANHFYPMTDKINEETYDGFMKWKTVSDKMSVWVYYLNYKNYFIPFDSFRTIAQNNRFFYENGVMYIYNQHPHVLPMGSDWYRLKEWLNAQLTWDCYQDVNALYEEFFDNYFYEASDIMYEFFMQERAHFDYLSETIPDIVADIRTDKMLNSDYWPKQTLLGWLDLMDEAQKKAEVIKERDRALYEKVSERIMIESISIRYLYYKLYAGELSSAEYDAIRNGVVHDCQKIGFTRWNEHDWTLSNL